jgi:Sec-independent protein translocase protein TatA
MGLGTEILFILILGLLVSGPKQLHTFLGHVARAKAQFEEASRGFKSRLAVELDVAHQGGKTDASARIGSNQSADQMESVSDSTPRHT